MRASIRVRSSPPVKQPTKNTLAVVGRRKLPPPAKVFLFGRLVWLCGNCSCSVFGISRFSRITAEFAGTDEEDPRELSQALIRRLDHASGGAPAEGQPTPGLHGNPFVGSGEDGDRRVFAKGYGEVLKSGKPRATIGAFRAVDLQRNRILLRPIRTACATGRWRRWCRLGRTVSSA